MANLEELHRTAEAARAKAEKAEREIAEQEALEAQNRSERERIWDEGVLASFNDARFEELERQAQTAFRAAVLRDPAYIAWVNLQTLRRVRRDRVSEAQGIVTRHGLPERRLSLPGSGVENFGDAVKHVLDSASANAGEDDHDVRWQRRAQFIEGDDTLDPRDETLDLRNP
jgi:hypothetical protein